MKENILNTNNYEEQHQKALREEEQEMEALKNMAHASIENFKKEFGGKIIIESGEFLE